MPEGPARLAVALRAASGATAAFQTQNGQAVQGVPSQALDLPHLVLYRNDALTPATERTLILDVSGINAPAPGVTVTVEIEAQHRNPDLGGEAGPGISVWRASQWIARTSDVGGTGATARFEHTFRATVSAGSGELVTPTGYFRYSIAVTDAVHLPTSPLAALNGEYAFLMDSQWIAPLPKVRETAPGAAPDELIVHYIDTVPFCRNAYDRATCLPREDLTSFVGAELLPRMIETYRVQSDEWGLAWTPAWVSYRRADPERLSVALTDGRTWYHGWAPSRGHSGISINVSGGDNADYDTLADGIVSVFEHELFHNHQRNIHLSLGGDGQVGGAENAWKFFSEGTAALASSVGQPDLHFATSERVRTYMSYANRFVQWGGGRFQDLIANHDREDPYSAVLYWRFLYEQCGGMGEGIERPAAGMAIVRRALTVLYSGTIVDVATSTDLPGATPEILDRALAGSSCPFQTYRQSLVAFARALYALRLEGGRCREPGLPAGCGLYDPHDLYRNPYLTTILFTGAAQEHRHEIARGAAMAFVDVLIDPTADGQPLTLELRAPSEAADAFSMCRSCSSQTRGRVRE